MSRHTLKTASDSLSPLNDISVVTALEFHKHPDPDLAPFLHLSDTVSVMAERSFTDEELRQRLTAEQYHITQQAGTERAFTGEYWDCKDEGTYRCRVCDEVLFSSETKYDSGTGWPSFYEEAGEGKVDRHTDSSHGMARTEAVCGSCGAHLGHIFPDGPHPTGERYCMNSASLHLDRDTTGEES